MSKKPFALSLGTRIFVATGLVLILALGTALAITAYLGDKIGGRTARERLRAASSLQASFAQQRFRQLKLLTQVIAGDPAFKAYLLQAIDDKDSLSIADQLDERGKDLGFDFAMLISPQGRLLVRTDNPNVTGSDLSKEPLVAKALGSGEASGVWKEESRLYEALAVPMSQGFNVFAYLVVGFAMNDVRALDVKRASGTEVGFLAQGPTGAALVASTLEPGVQTTLIDELRRKGDLLSRVLTRGEAIDQVDVTLAGEHWIGLLAPLRDAAGAPAGASLALDSLDRELEGFREIRNLLFALGLAALAATLGLSYLISRRVFAPVNQLVLAANAARDGNYDVKIPESGASEVVALAHSFNVLLADLREKRDMQEYVTRLSRNLPEAPPTALRPVAPAGRPERTKATILGLELRRYAQPKPGADPDTTLQRLGRDLRAVATAVQSNGGTLEAVYGHRAIASFTGPMRTTQAVAAAAAASAAVGRREHAFDDAEPPAAAIAGGDAMIGSVAYGGASDRSLVGTPVAQVESLLREAHPGDILLAPAVHGELATTLAEAGVEIQPQRGLLSTQPLYPLSQEGAARLTGIRPETAGQTVAMADTAGGDRSTLRDIGPGSVLGSRFEVLQVLGAGGMGIVFKARDRELDDFVALKMLKREVAGDATLVDRLKSELKLARKITHPNVLRTFDFGEVDGLPFISMEYVRGLTLRSMLEQTGRPPFSAGLRLARQVLSGLAAAHALAIIHRDIKPENVILDQTGNAKIMDFGLARPVKRITPGQTQAGFIVGTPHYLAPEQIEGREADTRSDVYALGVMLYEVFTGQLPLGGDNPMDILMKHLKEPPVDPRQYWPEIPERLRLILLRCLEKDPAKRYENADALLKDVSTLTF